MVRPALAAPAPLSARLLVGRRARAPAWLPAFAWQASITRGPAEYAARCASRPRWLLCREGWKTNQKWFRRLYREERLHMRRRGDRQQALETRCARLVIGSDATDRWKQIVRHSIVIA